MAIADYGKARGIPGWRGMDWIAHVTEALFSTYRGASKLPDEILAVEGYSSPLGRRLLNNLCDFDGCRYVEVGTWLTPTSSGVFDRSL